MTPDLTRAAPLIAKGYGDRRLSNALGVTRWRARVLIGEAQRGAPAAVIDYRDVLTLYTSACHALAQARTTGEVISIHQEMEHLKLHGRQVKDRTLIAEATAIQLNADRKLGEIIQKAEAAGLIRPGRPRKNPAESEGFTLAEADIDYKTSARAQKAASLSQQAFDAMVANTRDRILSGQAVKITGEEINGARSVMGSRQEPDDSLDYFPTPPWATRALIDRVFVHLGIRAGFIQSAWDPACGEGHIVEVLKEYCPKILASDVFDYGYMHKHEEFEQIDFLSASMGPYPPENPNTVADWIITNPPFSGSTDRALEFTLRALELAREGVAMFVRSQWAVEGQERYERLFRDWPATLCAFFTERVNLCKGRWDPNGGTATAYCWLVWLKRQKPGEGLQVPQSPFWIPPGCRKSLTRPDDIARFAAWSLDAPPHDPVTGEIPEATQ